jgi:branched-chain amino acid transport system substrate-binding protein
MKVRWLLVAALLATAACGNRLDHDEVLAANRASVELSDDGIGPSAGPGPAEADDVVDDPVDDGVTQGSGPSATASPSAQGDPARAERSPIVIGNIGTYSGIIGAILGTGQRGIEVWAAYVNAHGGIDGHPVELLTADDGGDPARALALAKDFVENRGAIAFVSNLTPLTTGAYRSYLESKRIPVVGGDLLTPTWFESPMFFPQGGTFVASTLGGARLAVDRGRPKLGTLVCVEVDVVCEFAQSIMEEGAERMGADYVFKASASLAQPDFTSECLGAQRAGVQSLFVILDGNSTRRLADDCAAQGFRPLIITNSLGLVKEVLQSPNVNGLVSPAQTFPFTADDTDATREFQDAFQQLTGGPPQAGPQSSAWTSGRLLELAGTTLPEDPTAADLLEGLWRIQGNDLGGLAGPLAFNRERPPTAVNCYFLVGIEGGQFVDPEGSKLTCL